MAEGIKTVVFSYRAPSGDEVNEEVEFDETITDKELDVELTDWVLAQVDHWFEVK